MVEVEEFNPLMYPDVQKGSWRSHLQSQAVQELTN
jgi:hypothetical protein